MDWADIQARLVSQPDKLWSLNEMEASGGEPDVVAYDQDRDLYSFVDCAPESPKARRSLCYDPEALASRKEHKPAHSAVGMAADMGVELLDEAQYRELQALGEFDVKTSSWVLTPDRYPRQGRRDLLRPPLRPCLHLSQRRGIVLQLPRFPGHPQSLINSDSRPPNYIVVHIIFS